MINSKFINLGKTLPIYLGKIYLIILFKKKLKSLLLKKNLDLYKLKKRPFYRHPIVDSDLPLLTHTVTGMVDYELSYPTIR